MSKPCRKKYPIGTILQLRRNPEVRLRILAYIRDGYEWEYVDVPGPTFWSSNSMDPWFEVDEWIVAPVASPPTPQSPAEE